MRWKAYLSSITVIILLRFLDLFITFKITPDLSHEWNPLVSVFGLSWSGLIGTQILIVTFVSVLMYFYFKRTPAQKMPSGLTFLDFNYVYFFDEMRPFPQRIFSVPRNIRKHLVFNGFLFMHLTILISCFAIVNNILIMQGIDLYTNFIELNHGIFFPSVFAVVTIFTVYLFFIIEYKKYRLMSDR